MKALNDHVLIYDGDCPMCRMYSHAFVKSGMLEEKGIQSYDAMTENVKRLIDSEKSRNEIALVNTASGSVEYGIDSWFKIFNNNFRILKILSRFKPFYWFMKGLYFFISYNRRVIAPGKEFQKAGSCDPDFNAAWRWIYIVFASFTAAWLLNTYLKAIPLCHSARIGVVAEWLIVSGQLVFQGIFVFFTRRDRILHYFGHLMTISLIGGLLLIPAIVFQKPLTAFSEWSYLIYFIIPLVIMLWQHMKRTAMLDLPILLTFTWIGYRVILLIAFLVFTKTIEVP